MTIRLELVPVCFLKLILELDPMKAQRMQETFQLVHGHEHCDLHAHKNQECHEGHHKA